MPHVNSILVKDAAVTMEVGSPVWKNEKGSSLSDNIGTVLYLGGGLIQEFISTFVRYCFQDYKNH